MSDLKEILFHRTWVALNAYLDADKELDEYKGIGSAFDSLRRIRRDRLHRFSALWELIETAGLEGEYEDWKMATAEAALANLARKLPDRKEAAE